MRLPSLLAAALFLSVASEAAAQRVRVVTRVGADGAFTASPVQARVGEAVSLAVVLQDTRGSLLGASVPVRLGARVQTPSPWPVGTRVRWLRVVPRMEHVERPSPNPGLTSFSNAVLFGPRHGRWIGYDRLEYETRALAPEDAEVTGEGTLTVHRARLDVPRGGAGSMWFSAEVTLPDGRTLRAADGASVDTLGLSREVPRVSFRADDTYLGWLGTYFGVPNVFGSNGTSADHQTDRYAGADCADVLVGALRAMGRRGVAYLSVAQIHVAAVRRSGARVLDGAGVVGGAEGPLRWGREVAPGDLVTLGYRDDASNSLPRAWDHIAALVSDTNGNGVLDGADTIRHVTGRGLDETPLLHAGSMHIALWRWRSR